MLEMVHEIGAAAAVSAVVGQAVLSALYVSQAREVKRLREWAGRAPERRGRGVTAVPERAPSHQRPIVAVAIAGAAALRDQIDAAGFKQGTIHDYSDKQLAESVVQYAPGHQAEAKAVSRRFGISRLEPVTADSRALAGDATVIVIARADKAP